MRKSAIATLAVATLLSSAVLAKPGEGNGHGNGNGNGNGNGKSSGHVAAKSHGNGGNKGSGKPQAVVHKIEKKVDRVVQRVADHPGNSGKNIGARQVREARVIDQGDGVIRQGVRVVEERAVRRVADRRYSTQVSQGCPPGLAKKFNGCMPPGLAKQRVERDYYEPHWWGYASAPNERYYYNDGYLLRLGSNNRIDGYVPLLAGALGLGSVWPSYFEPQTLSPYYVDYYELGPAASYRYADGVIYDVDPGSAVISSVVALLTGDDFQVGSPMPAGYGVYNVPYDYRDRYYDTPDAMYRYSDGYIYEIDPKTQLIAAAISLLT
ncbi:MAG: hypothetical protein KDE55_12770 [Novosphingobium sp.]|nr:hypothetical protein [Novosphingobium sp.]